MLAICLKPVFLLNSLAGYFTATGFTAPYPLSYGVNLPSFACRSWITLLIYNRFAVAGRSTQLHRLFYATHTLDGFVALFHMLPYGFPLPRSSSLMCLLCVYMYTGANLLSISYAEPHLPGFTLSRTNLPQKQIRRQRFSLCSHTHSENFCFYTVLMSSRSCASSQHRTAFTLINFSMNHNFGV